MNLPISEIQVSGRFRKDFGDLDALANSIASIGLLHPVVVNRQKRLVAGQRRLVACQRLGWKEIPVTWIDNLEEIIPITKAERDENTCRKDFAPSEAVALGERLEELEKPKAEERKAKGVKAGGKVRQGKQLGGNLPPSSKTRDVVGAAVGMSGKTYETAKKVVQAARVNPEHADLVDKMDQTNPTAALRELKEREKEKRRQANARQVESTPVVTVATKAKFSTIVIDPPWDWGDEGDTDQLGRARPGYATMPLSELLALPLGDLSDSDCHIYLWITNRSLPKGFQLLERWGFRYVTCLTWCKPSFGMGNYFRGSTEQVLFGVKGSQMLKRKDCGTWFQAPRGPNGHSSKPVEFYSLVESCSPGPYLEMFARSSRSGWKTWGAEVAR